LERFFLLYKLQLPIFFLINGIFERRKYSDVALCENLKLAKKITEYHYFIVHYFLYF
jgi:hypothetical protein